MNYVPVNAADLVRRLEPPSSPCNVVIDADAYNEIDDQFAIVHALLSDRLNVEAIYAAPFHNERRSTDGPGDGMEMSFQEIGRLLEMLPVDYTGTVARGSEKFMCGPEQPVQSPAVDHLIERAHAGNGSTLYILALGALTNVASALVKEPSITTQVTVVTLGGAPYESGHYQDFNFSQDIHAARVIFGSGVAVVHVPGYFVSEAMRTTEPELAKYVKGSGLVGNYLYSLYKDWVPEEPGRSKAMWDLAPGGYLIDPGWTQSHLTQSPILNDHYRYGYDLTRHPVRVVTRVDRDRIFSDLFEQLSKLK